MRERNINLEKEEMKREEREKKNRDKDLGKNEKKCLSNKKCIEGGGGGGGGGGN